MQYFKLKLINARSSQTIVGVESAEEHNAHKTIM